MMKELENKNVEEIKISDVPSLNGIKSKMDFSKNKFRNKVEVSYFKRQVTFASFMSSFVTLIICLVIVFAVHMISNRNEAGYDVNETLLQEEINSIEEDNYKLNSEYILRAKLNDTMYLYIFEADNRDLGLKKYYYKVNTKKFTDFNILITERVIKVSEEYEFGLLCSTSENSRIEFEIEYDGVRKYYSFSN